MRLLAMTARTALRALRRNKLRSALTMLGIVIGVAAVIVMVSIGQGASQAVREQIQSLGTNLLMVVPGATTSAGVRSGSGGVSTLTLQDAKAIATECSAVVERRLDEATDRAGGPGRAQLVDPDPGRLAGILLGAGVAGGIGRPLRPARRGDRQSRGAARPDGGREPVRPRARIRSARRSGSRTFPSG